MIINAIEAKYLEGFQIALKFNTGDYVVVDLEETIRNDSRTIFFPLRDPDYFKNFKIYLNTIVWQNEADFAPEFLLNLGKQQNLNKP